jgi:hypothetical protein
LTFFAICAILKLNLNKKGDETMSGLMIGWLSPVAQQGQGFDVAGAVIAFIIVGLAIAAVLVLGRGQG